MRRVDATKKDHPILFDQPSTTTRGIRKGHPDSSPDAHSSIPSSPNSTSRVLDGPGQVHPFVQDPTMLKRRCCMRKTIAGSPFATTRSFEGRKEDGRRSKIDARRVRSAWIHLRRSLRYPAQDAFRPPVHFTRASAISRYDILSRIRRNLAVGVGFEPTEPLGSPVFKTGAFGHSATPPRIISASERCKPPDAFCARSAKTVKSEITRLE